MDFKIKAPVIFRKMKFRRFDLNYAVSSFFIVQAIIFFFFFTWQNQILHFYIFKNYIHVSRTFVFFFFFLIYFLAWKQIFLLFFFLILFFAFLACTHRPSFHFSYFFVIHFKSANVFNTLIISKKKFFFFK